MKTVTKFEALVTSHILVTVQLMNKISTKHLMFFILATTIIALRSYSSIFIKLGGRDTALIAVIATIIYIFFLMFNLKIIKETDSLDLNETFNRTFPKFISITFLSMFIIGLFLASIESVAVEANSIPKLVLFIIFNCSSSFCFK